MIYVGCDLGISAAKLVITKNRNILAYEIVPYKNAPKQAAIMAMKGALQKAGLSETEVISCLATGFGAKAVPFANHIDIDTNCLLRGLKKLNPQIRTVIDVGGHTLTASNIDSNFNLIESAILEDCVAGTGLFIDMIAKALESTIADFANSSVDSVNPVRITNTCVVFAESEVISLVSEGKSRAEIFAGVIQAVAAKIAGISRRVDIIPEVAMTGGVARHIGIATEIENQFGMKLADLNGIDPQIISAYGAALLAEEKHIDGNRPEVERK